VNWQLPEPQLSGDECSGFSGEGEVNGGAVGRGGGNRTLEYGHGPVQRSCSSAQANHRPDDQRVDIINARECQGSIHGVSNALRHFIITAAGSSMTDAAATVIKRNTSTTDYSTAKTICSHGFKSIIL